MPRQKGILSFSSFNEVNCGNQVTSIKFKYYIEIFYNKKLFYIAKFLQN